MSMRDIHVITDTERIALYGLCETCGAPRDCADMEFTDGSQMMALICVEHPMEHPA